MAGCAVTGVEQKPASSLVTNWLYTGDSVTYLSSTHSGLLEQAVPGKVLSLSRSPWGENTRIHVKENYFSASGKTCFSTMITATDSAPKAVNICKYSSDRWGVTKAVSPVEPGRSQHTAGDFK